MMKKYFVLMCIAAICCFASCSDNEETKVPVTEAAQEEVDTPASADDQLTRTTAMPAVVIGNHFDGVGKALVDRLSVKMPPTVDNIAQAKVVVIDCSALEEIDTRTFYAIFEAGLQAAVVWTEPSYNAEELIFVKMMEALTEYGDADDQYTYQVRRPYTRAAESDNEASTHPLSCLRVEEDDPSQPFADMVVNQGDDVYLVTDFDDHDGNPIQVTIVDTLGTDTEDEKPLKVERREQTLQVSSKSTPCQLGIAADGVVEWIESRSAGTRAAELDNMVSAQQVFMTMPVRNEVEGALVRHATATMHMDIWSIYDFEKKADFVLIHQSGICYNRELGYSLADDRGYVVMIDGDNWLCNGPYMERVILGAAFNSWDDIELIKPSPGNTNRNTTTTSGFNWNVGGNIGLNSNGLTGGFSGGATFTKSYGISTPEMRIENNCTSGGNVSWSYIGPDSHWDRRTFFNQHTHPQPARSQIGTYSDIHNTWIWKIPNPSGSYSLTAMMEVVLENELIPKVSGIKRSPRKTYFPKSSKSVDVAIAQPARSMQKVHVFTDVDVDDKLNRFLERYKEEYLTSKTVYDFTDQSTKAVDRYVNQMKDTFNAHKAEWVKAGLTGKYEFSVYRNNQPYTTFVVDCTQAAK